MTSGQNPVPPNARPGIEELEDLYEQAPCGYLSLDPGGRINRVNATFLAWTGYGAEELLGRHFQSLLNIPGKIFYETHFAPLLRLQGFFNEVALDLIGSDRSPIPTLVNAVERRDADGKTTFIRITVFNATDRRRYERELLAARNDLAKANQELRDLNDQLRVTNQELDRANRELHAFYDTLPVGVFRADTSGRIVQASRRFCTLLCIDANEQWLDAVMDADRSGAMQHLQRAMENAEPFSRQFQVDGGDGAMRQIEMKAVPIPGSDGDALTFVGVVEDVTEQKRVDAQKREIDRHAAVRQVTGGLAHNLNNLLVVITGNLEILEEDLGDRPALRPVFDAGLLATNRAAALVSRLLVYSGYSMSRHASIDIDPCLHDIAHALVGRFGQRHQFVCDLCAPGAVVELGADILREVVDELVANAVAAMPAGGEIRLSTRLDGQELSSGQRKIVIAVADQGIGMDEATLAKTREPFFTTRDVGQGIGLGLSFVDGVARIAGGELTLRSRQGKGTVVEMHLPVAN